MLLAWPLSAVLATCALARDDGPSDYTIVHTIQCEAGKVGERLKAEHDFPLNLKAVVSWTSTKTQDSSAGLGFKVFNFGASGDLGNEALEQLRSDGLRFNLNPQNLSVCRGYEKDIIKEGVGIYDCLINEKLASLRAAIEGGSGSASCRHQTTLSKKVSGNLRLDFWGADLGPSGSWGDTFVYTFDIAAPSPKK
jgi:hypothetical protein